MVVIDTPFGLAISMDGLIHPTTFLLHSLSMRRASRSRWSHPLGIVIVSNERGGGREIISMALRAPIFEMGLSPSKIVPSSATRYSSFRQLFCPHSAGQQRRHSGAAEAVEDHFTRVSVMQNIAHDGFMRHFGMVRVGIIDWIVLALRYIRGKRLAVIFSF